MNVSDLLTRLEGAPFLPSKQPENPFSLILTSVVRERSTSIFNDTEELTAALRQAGATPLQCDQFRLMTHVTGFRALLESDGRMMQSDLNRFVQNAMDETGLSKALILSLISALADALGFPFSARIPESYDGESGPAYIVPPELYEREMKYIDTDDIDSMTLERLESWAHAGIPRAKYLLAQIMIRDAESKEEPPSPAALQLLEEAAAAGVSDACAALGDFYYKKYTAHSWQKAYECYTGYGSLALTPSRTQAIARIKNDGVYNRKVLQSSLLLALLTLLMIVIAPCSGLYAAHRIFGTLCALAVAAVAVYAVIRQKQKPYDTIIWLPALLFAILFLYTAVRFIF